MRETRVLSCIVHDTPRHPRQPLEGSGDEPLVSFLRSLAQLRLKPRSRSSEANPDGRD
ncbi:MAG: hypothetical protein HY717_05570 [Planctomycetes bacterium]|nr:hypothetical protein [Planctomycetota bacterium]